MQITFADISSVENSSRRSNSPQKIPLKEDSTHKVDSSTKKIHPQKISSSKKYGNRNIRPCILPRIDDFSYTQIDSTHNRSHTRKTSSENGSTYWRFYPCKIPRIEDVNFGKRDPTRRRGHEENMLLIEHSGRKRRYG